MSVICTVSKVGHFFTLIYFSPETKKQVGFHIGKSNMCLVVGNFESKWFSEYIELQSAVPHNPETKFRRPWAVNATILLIEKTRFKTKSLKENIVTVTFDSGQPAAFNLNDKIIHQNYIGHIAAHFHKTVNPGKSENYFPQFQCSPNIFDDKSIYFEISVISPRGNRILFQMCPRDFIKPTGSNNTCMIHITNIYYDDYTNNVMIGVPFFRKYFIGYNYDENKLILGKTIDGKNIC